MPVGISPESEIRRSEPLPITTVVTTVILAGVLLASCSSCTGVSPELQQKPVQQAPLQRQSGENVAVELLNLYEEYREFLADEDHDRREFRTVQNAITIIEDRVVIDATARGDAERLRQDLAGIGGVNLAAAQNLVSCQLPILAIRQLHTLDSLKFARPSYMTTRMTTR